MYQVEDTMKNSKNPQRNQRKTAKTDDTASVIRKEISAAPGEFRQSALESTRSPEDGRDD
jgi:hypothetical protein